MLVLRIFDQLQAAESARQTLLSAGFDASRLKLSASDDEAGALQGNFVAGNAKTGQADDATYEANFGNVALGSRYLLSADGDEESGRRALSMLEQFGGRDLDPASGRITSG